MAVSGRVLRVQGSSCCIVNSTVGPMSSQQGVNNVQDQLQAYAGVINDREGPSLPKFVCSQTLPGFWQEGKTCCAKRLKTLTGMIATRFCAPAARAVGLHTAAIQFASISSAFVFTQCWLLLGCTLAVRV
jgi:hypothetical protein